MRGKRPLIGKPTRRDARFRLMYERFRELLNLNDSTLQLIADIEDGLAGHARLSWTAIVTRVHQATMDVFVMVKDLNQIAEGRHVALYDALRRISLAIDRETEKQEDATGGQYTISLSEVRSGDALLAGNKMANLGEVRNTVGLKIPDGFVITTAAFSRFMAANGLWKMASRLEHILDTRGAAALGEACEEVQSAIRSALLPADVEAAIRDAFARLANGGDVTVAVRSSAHGEDGAMSHAGQYHTELAVRAPALIDAYRKVVASAFGVTAVTYRYEAGFSTKDTAVAVGVMRMIDPRCAGILFSRHYEDPRADQVVLSAARGIAADIASGREGGEEIVIAPGRLPDLAESCLQEEEFPKLYELARTLERHFGAPQDIEWAIDRQSTLYVLQARPMVQLLAPGADAAPAGIGEQPILEGGRVACPGAGSGPVHFVTSKNDLAAFPEGGVLVAKHSSPEFSRVLRHCAAVVTDVGSPIGHMAILAREFRVPTIVGLPGATTRLSQGQMVTVDASHCRVFAGETAIAHAAAPAAPPPTSPMMQSLRRIAAYITPLHLTDPTSPEFSPEGCRSLHDITRYIHEKVFDVMFHYGDAAMADRQMRMTLDARLPTIVLVFDVGGAVNGSVAPGQKLPPEQIVSVPVNAFLKGMMDPRIRWDQPRPISGRGFLSVLGESMVTAPPESSEIGRPSYVVMSDRYMNFSTKAGYHFSTVDAYCGASTNMNYIHFRFTGGGADESRRSRRVRFLSEVLGALDFRVRHQRDEVIARLQKYPGETITARLTELGRLTMVARQLDMLMDSDASPELYAKLFLEGRMDKF